MLVVPFKKNCINCNCNQKAVLFFLKSTITMKYNITKSHSPKMPVSEKGTERPQILLKQASKDMYAPVVPMLFPVLGAHISGTEFQYPDLSWKEPCGMMANLVGDSGCNKGQLSNLVEAICRDFRTHDEAELQKLVAWQRQMKTRSANKEKPVRPEVAFFSPPAETSSWQPSKSPQGAIGETF